jgi:protein SCO1
MKDHHPKKKNTRFVVLMVVIVLMLVVSGFLVKVKNNPGTQITADNTPAAASASAPAQPQTSGNQTILPSPKTISNFSLTDDSGNSFTNDNLKGHWTLMAFGFSHCGDVCPISLTELNKMYQKLQHDLPAGQLPQVVFISVDPARDTQAVLHNYIKNYNPSFIAASGTHDNLQIFVNDMGVYYSKKPNTAPNVYGMEHSSQLYLFNPDGKWIGIETFPFQAEQLTNNYQAMIHATPTTT